MNVPFHRAEILCCGIPNKKNPTDTCSKTPVMNYTTFSSINSSAAFFSFHLISKENPQKNSHLCLVSSPFICTINKVRASFPFLLSFLSTFYICFFHLSCISFFNSHNSPVCLQLRFLTNLKNLRVVSPFHH